MDFEFGGLEGGSGGDNTEEMHRTLNDALELILLVSKNVTQYTYSAFIQTMTRHKNRE